MRTPLGDSLKTRLDTHIGDTRLKPQWGSIRGAVGTLLGGA